MAAMTNLLVKDDTVTTPVEYTLLPITDTPNPIWRSSIAGVPLEGQIRYEASAVKQKNGTYKITAKLEVPIMETLGASGTSTGYVAPPKVAYVVPVIITMFADKRSTSQDRANALKLALGLAQGASSTTATGTLKNTDAGQTFVNSVLPIPQLFTAVVVPN